MNTSREIKRMHGKGGTPPLTEEHRGYTFASKDMAGRLNSHRKPWTIRTICQYNVEQVLYKHNSRHSVRDKKISEKTKSTRWIEVKAAFNVLHRDLGMRIVYPTSLTKKHIIALTRYWEAKGYAVATIQNKESAFRVFCGWIGKREMMEDIPREHLYAEPKKITRSNVTKTDKSWSGKEDNPLALFDEVEKTDHRVAMQLRLSYYFGFRVREAARFRPHTDIDSKGRLVIVSRGPKGGKRRLVSVTSDEQRAVLEALKKICYDRYTCLIPRNKNQSNWMQYYYRVCRAHGISREEGKTTHGLRHKYAQELYEEHAGVPPKVVTGQAPEVESVIDIIARRMVSESLGHNRLSITSAYIGDNK